MCFSATASFTASAALGVTGIATLSKIKNIREAPLASIPLIFAAQQFIEGLLWLTLAGTGTYALPLTYLYQFFALFWWPIFIPLTVYLLENQSWRKKIITLFFLFGIIVGISQYATFLRGPISGQIVNRCISYNTDSTLPLSSLPFIVLYGLATVGACLISSKKIIKIFGIMGGIFALFAWHVYAVNFSSVWCFFAAILSIIIYLHF